MVPDPIPIPLILLMTLFLIKKLIRMKTPIMTTNEIGNGSNIEIARLIPSDILSQSNC